MKFVFMYHNGRAVDGVSQEKIMEDWGAWMEELGEKLVDGGNPFNHGGKAVSNSGVSDVESGTEYPDGYSIVEAKDMNEAVELAKGCPMHEHSEGKAIVRIFEAMPM